MAVLSEGFCALGGGFLRRACGAEPIGQCVYCGAPFCERHGELGPEHHEVCSRATCQTKFADVRNHRDWVDAHHRPNTVSMCAADDCREWMQHQCQRCQLRFCDAHVKIGNVIEQRYDPPQKLTLIMCAHCVSRRRIWD